MGCKRSSAPLSSTDRDKLDHLRAELDDVCSNIAAKFNLNDSKGRPRKAFILNTLMEYSCVGCILRSFTQQHEKREDVDAIYRENHRLAVNLLSEHLQYRLSEEGFNILVQNEVEGNYGRIDVLVQQTGFGVLLKSRTKEVVIEVKTGRSLSYSQLFRYIVDRPDATVIIWRILMNQVLVIPKRTTIQLLLSFLEIAIRRATLLLSEGEKKSCSHNNTGEKTFVIKNPERVIGDFASGLTKTVSRVADTVVNLLVSDK